MTFREWLRSSGSVFFLRFSRWYGSSLEQTLSHSQFPSTQQDYLFFILPHSLVQVSRRDQVISHVSAFNGYTRNSLCCFLFYCDVICLRIPIHWNDDVKRDAFLCAIPTFYHYVFYLFEVFKVLSIRHLFVGVGSRSLRKHLIFLRLNHCCQQVVCFVATLRVHICYTLR